MKSWKSESEQIPFLTGCRGRQKDVHTLEATFSVGYFPRLNCIMVLTCRLTFARKMTFIKRTPAAPRDRRDGHANSRSTAVVQGARGHWEWCLEFASAGGADEGGVSARRQPRALELRSDAGAVCEGHRQASRRPGTATSPRGSRRRPRQPGVSARGWSPHRAPLVTAEVKWDLYSAFVIGR